MFHFLFPVGVVAAIIHVICLFIFAVAANPIVSKGKTRFHKIISAALSLSSVIFMLTSVLMFFTFHSWIFSVLIALSGISHYLYLRSQKAKKAEMTSSGKIPNSFSKTEIRRGIIDALEVAVRFLVPYFLAFKFG